ncbi:MAG: hypothetical protein B6I24_05140 [Bacteroidetes bacterium 4572_128]|nr:MAG: hypothetical protein B6I24_05140 [Bacteroidetes bacterium 4572_128]
MKKIYNSKLQEIYYDVSKSLIKNVWLSDDMDFDDIKKEMKNWMAKFKEKKPKYMLTDSSINLIIVPEVQEWIINFLFPTIVKRGVLKYAIILSDDIFAEISIEQMFDEEKDIPNNKFQQYFFKDEKKH